MISPVQERQLTLFPEAIRRDIEFPEPQYLGAKYVHRWWIAQYIPDGAQVVLDAFAGSQSVSFMMKQLGKTTICNDFLNFNNQIGKALIENKDTVLNGDDVDSLFSGNRDPEYYNLFSRLYADLFFSRDEAEVIDAFRSNVDSLKGEYKRSLALAVMCRSLTRKVTMGHFAHTQALRYAASPERVKRNRSLVRPLKDIFCDLLPEYNQAVFDNSRSNLSYNCDVLDLIPRLNNVDFVYLDPPYCNSHADYQSFYHLLETFVEYWKQKEFVNSVKRYSPKKYSGFDKKKDAIHSLRKLFEVSVEIPTWLLSYNDRSYPDIQTLISLIEPYRKVEVHRKVYDNSRGGKGSVAGSSEVLILCKK